MRTIKAVEDITGNGPFLFLAGSIEMGEAPNWQRRVERALAWSRWTLLNPRRDDWNPSWVQSISNPQFREQINWELTAMERADRILIYFGPGTKSPISLLELGLFAASGKLLVVCPEAFWRKGNVDIVCRRYGPEMAPSLEAAIQILAADAGGR